MQKHFGNVTPSSAANNMPGKMSSAQGHIDDPRLEPTIGPVMIKNIEKPHITSGWRATRKSSRLTLDVRFGKIRRKL